MTTPRKEQINREEITARLVTFYREHVTREDLAAGIDWYSEAFETARNIAAGTDHSPETIAAVISAVSPRMPWGRNKAVARTIVERHAAGNIDTSGLGLTKNIGLGFKILDGANPTHVLRDKRLAFYRNISGDENSITVDIWATRAAFGSYEFTGPGRYYSEVELAYQDAAELVSLPPREFQAAVWVAIRRENLSENNLKSLDK